MVPIPKSPRDGLLVPEVILPTRWPQVDLLLAMGGWSCGLLCGLAAPQSDCGFCGAAQFPLRAGVGCVLCGSQALGIHSYLPHLQKQPSSGLDSRCRPHPRASSGGCVPGALSSLVGLFPTVLMLAPFALGLWFKEEQGPVLWPFRSSCKKNSRKQPR